MNSERVHMGGFIRPLSDENKMEIFKVINEAAKKYKNRIPDDCYSEPYMPLDMLDEMRKMQFYGYLRNSLVLLDSNIYQTTTCF